MRKQIRKKLAREKLEALLEKYQRRMQRISEEAYNIRQIIEQMDAEQKAKEEPKDAVHTTEQA